MNSPGAFPLLKLTLDGKTFPDRDMEGLVGLRLQQRLSQPGLCELYFRHPPGPLEFLASISPGAALQVWVQGSPQVFFSGDVSALEYHYLENSQKEVYLRAYDRLHRLRQRQAVRVFEEITLSGLVQNLCQDVGLTLSAHSDSHLTWPLLVQHTQSDLDLLVERAALEGLYLALSGDTLHLVSLAGLPGQAVPLALGENLFKAHLEVNHEASSQRVVAWGWNPSMVEPVRAEASAPRSGGKAPARLSGSAPQRSLVNEAAPSRGHAAALAQADLDRRAASEVTFQGVAAGNPALQPGCLVDVSGVAPHVAGRYVLTQVTHLVDASGYRAELDTAPPQPAPSPQADLATFGEVIDVRDPEDHARVRVRLPTYNDIESGWIPVIIPGAGPDKGLIALPDLGDTVLVLLLRGIPGLVLGGLYGRQRVPASGVEGKRVHTYTWITPGKQKIQLSDELAGGKIRLENEAGAYIELDGGNITIAGRAIDFKQT
jgi:phage protein D